MPIPLSLIVHSTLLLTIFFSACKEDDDLDSLKNLNLNISGLEDLRSDAIYEGWLIVNGAHVTTGTFSIDGSGTMSKTSL
jgi:hypothetical protein